MKFVLGLLSKLIKSEGVSYLGLGVIAFMAFFIVGALFRATELKLDAAEQQVKTLEEEIHVQKEIQTKYVQVVDKLQLDLDHANSLARARGVDVERLRNANAKLQAKLASSPTEPNAEALARCSALLTEGAGLVTEGERLLLKHGAEHDSLIRIEKWQ